MGYTVDEPSAVSICGALDSLDSLVSSGVEVVVSGASVSSSVAGASV